MSKFTTFVFGGLIITSSMAAFADDQGFYLGANAGIGKPNINTPNGLDKSSSAVGGIVLGYKFNPYLGTELQYTGIGKVTDNVRGTAKGDATSFTAIGTLPLNEDFSLYGKLGVAVTKTTVTSNLAPMNDATRTAPTYGAGAEYHLNKNLGMRLGWDYYAGAVNETGGSKNNIHSNVVSVGAVYNF
ncbi:MAG TPA: outer membrane beta-barrel protein [Methylotenera sp.]|nr:outer membrane beta-barrel protein [Methylotenera sp.]